MHELRDETDTYKALVHRLNQELSRYQAKFRTLTDNEVDGTLILLTEDCSIPHLVVQFQNTVLSFSEGVYIYYAPVN